MPHLLDPASKMAQFPDHLWPFMHQLWVSIIEDQVKKDFEDVTLLWAFFHNFLRQFLELMFEMIKRYINN